MMARNWWDDLAERCHLSRAFVKREFYYITYGAGADPWMTHIILQESDRMAMAPEWNHHGIS
jgi:hypothetical protein